MSIKLFRVSALWGVLAVLATFSVGVTPAFALQTQPQTTYSWYVAVGSGETVSNVETWAYNEGYAVGQRDLGLSGTQTTAVILDFGDPAYNGTSYGATGYGHFLSVNDIRLISREFAHGYYMGVGSDLTSQLTIMIGTNNDGTSSNVNYNHGRAWSFLVQDVASDLVTYGYSSQTIARGGFDAEPLYSTTTDANNWMSGYISAFTSPYYVYDFGSADGCPSSGTTATAGSCAHSWTQDNVRYMSWGASPALPFPEIYNTLGTNANQWQQISLYSYLAYGSKVNISSPLSQQEACLQNGCPSGVNNSPSAAWSQLWTALNNDSRTAQNLLWSDDMKWR